MDSESVISELRELLPGRLIADPEELFVYESDGFTIAKARPRAVTFPTTRDEVVAICEAE